MPSKTGMTPVLAGLQRVPGTTSLWAVGKLMDSLRWATTSDLILKYGR
jgi:hypothetical protein